MLQMILASRFLRRIPQRVVNRGLFAGGGRWRASPTVATLVLALMIGPASVEGQRRPPDSQSTNAVEIRLVQVQGKSVSWRAGQTLTLRPYPENVILTVGPATNSSRVPQRLRYRLEGHESSWHEGDGEMLFTVKFFDASGDQVAQRVFPVKGQSTGWAGTVEDSTLTHRRETITVPPKAAQVWVVVSSAGPPATVGIYVVSDLVIARLNSTNTIPEVLLRSPFDRRSGNESTNTLPEGWIRDGTLPSMAKIVELEPETKARAFAILDEDGFGHAEWHTLKEYAPAVKPGDLLELQWNELYNMGAGQVQQAHYNLLPPGTYTFRVAETTALGVPTGAEAVLNLRVPQPFWQMPWFWGMVATGLIAVAVASGRYFAWRKMRRKMLHLEHQRMLEQERLRIAQDIHDDLGARVTQISLLSAMAQSNTTFPEKAREEFDRVSCMSRELVAALYETVWAVNPENDNLDALGNYLCQMINQLCGPAQVRCRFHLVDLPAQVQVSSQIRHNVCLAVKEAVHNAIKHAHAGEIGVHMNYEQPWLTIVIEDDGNGFDPAKAPAGHGLKNMQRRLQTTGGTYGLESAAGRGTKVTMRLCLPAKGSLA